ncbi:MAG: hypothetical protein RLZZ303_1205 [Candidatus Hydrogenedentota bacterium]|jgi:prephenate dehydrogenase
MALFQEVQIIGCGLLGASLGLALKSRGLAQQVVGVGRNQSTLEKALAAGAIDEGSTDLSPSAQRADLIVLATPVGKCLELLGALPGIAKASAVMTDVGSTKAEICARAETLWPRQRRFIGSHPMAGSEKSGPEHASATLFDGAICLVEEHPALDPEALSHVITLWESVGSRVVRVEPRRHDAILARTSHLPHVIASALASLTGREGDVSSFVGNGFRDTTRIAASRPEVWTEICLTNQSALLDALRGYELELAEFRHALEQRNEAAIERYFAAGRDARGRIFPA